MPSSEFLSSVDIKLEEVGDSFEWDQLLDLCMYSCFSHRRVWLEALERLTHTRLLQIVARKGREIVAVVPLFIGRRGPLRAAYSPPLQGAIHHMGPVFPSFEGMGLRKQTSLLYSFQEALDRKLRDEEGCNYVEFRYPPHFPDTRHLIWHGYHVRPLYTYILDLREGIDRIWKGCSPDFRRNVRRCEERVTSRVGSSKELPPFLELVRDRYAEVNAQYPLSRDYLEALFGGLGSDRIRLITSEESDGLETGLILALHGKRATVWHGAVRPRSTLLPVNDHLHWFAIKWARERGFQEFEIMDADNPRLEEFKAKFNARLVLCPHAVKANLWSRMAERLGRETPSLF